MKDTKETVTKTRGTRTKKNYDENKRLVSLKQQQPHVIY